MRLSECELKWLGQPNGAVIERVRTDIAECLDDSLSHPSDLVFHTVLLGDDIETSPVVMVFGREGSDMLFCEYHESTDWVVLSGED